MSTKKELCLPVDTFSALTARVKRLDLDGEEWRSVLDATGQPPLLA